jgi:hypothetical protein
MKQLAAVLIIAALGVFAPAASATTILTFGQDGGSDPIAGKNNGAGSTTITGTNIPIFITQIAALVGTPAPAFLDLNATSTGAAVAKGTFVSQPYSGSFSITSGSGDTGINYLSGTFTDAVFGETSSLTLSVANPPDSVSFTSDVITDLSVPTGVALSFADVFPFVSIVNGSLGSFHSSVSGTFSGSGTSNLTPEPGSLMLVGLAMLGLAGSLRRKSRR